MMASIFLVLVLISATTSSEALGMSRLPLLRAVGHAVGHGRDRDGAVWALALTTGAHGADADSAIQASRGGGGSWRSSGGYGSSGGGRRRKRKSDVAVAVRSVRVGNTDILLTPTNLIIAANILVFALTKGVFGVGESRARLNALMKANSMVARGQVYRLFTSLFCHGSASHIAINSYSLYQMGPAAERMLGKGRFVFIYLASGVLANLLTFLAGSSPYSLGASGCTFGLIGAFACHFYRNQRVLGASAQAGLQSLKQTVLVNLFYGMSSPGIDNGAHVGGLVAGALCCYLIGPRLISVKQEFGGRAKFTDHPLVPYRRILATFNGYLFGPKAGSGSGSGSGAYGAGCGSEFTKGY